MGPFPTRMGCQIFQSQRSRCLARKTYIMGNSHPQLEEDDVDGDICMPTELCSPVSKIVYSGHWMANKLVQVAYHIANNSWPQVSHVKGLGNVGRTVIAIRQRCEAFVRYEFDKPASVTQISSASKQNFSTWNRQQRDDETKWVGDYTGWQMHCR